MKILIGLDDSPHSRAALEYVKRMPWPAGTKFQVLTAARLQVVSQTLVNAGGFSWIESAEEVSHQEAEEFTSRVERELRDAGLATEARVMPGDAGEALVESARGWGADLIVVGSHGRSGLRKILMGSVASHVVTHAPCSVLVVRKPH